MDPTPRDLVGAGLLVVILVALLVLVVLAAMPG
jgi:hypothetical protein